MYTRTRLVPLLLAGVYGALFTLGLEQLLLPPRAGLAFGAQATPPVIQAQQF